MASATDKLLVVIRSDSFSSFGPHYQNENLEFQNTAIVNHLLECFGGFPSRLEWLFFDIN